MRNLRSFPSNIVFRILFLLFSATAANLKTSASQRSEQSSKRIAAMKLRSEIAPICRNKKYPRALELRCHACLHICRHRHELQFQFLLAVAPRNPFVFHPLRRNLFVERRLHLRRTKQHGLACHQNVLTFCWQTSPCTGRSSEKEIEVPEV